ncbi:MAG: vitamin B12 dependent-methionine synthase activation domain-containing protein, partial [Bacteroidota bacterium]|nr:vitamin B12 dependent-methionine synthase activation domain-containing protein [Bacteroidota bacterium]
NVEEKIGTKLTENFSMSPVSSVSGLYFAHQEAKYFGIGKIMKDQIHYYAKAKNKSVQTIKKFLAQNIID